MPRPTTAKLLADALELFHTLGRQIDELASEEETRSIPEQLDFDAKAKGFREEASRVAAKLNNAAPGLGGGKMDVLRSTSLMLAEITQAKTPELVTERYHDRRTDIESGLIALAR